MVTGRRTLGSTTPARCRIERKRPSLPRHLSMRPYCNRSVTLSTGCGCRAEEGIQVDRPADRAYARAKRTTTSSCDAMLACVQPNQFASEALLVLGETYNFSENMVLFCR